MTNRFIVYERTQGSKCWTMAHRSGDASDLAAEFESRGDAEEWIRIVHSMRRGWWGGKPNQRPMQAYIAEVDMSGVPS